MDTPETLSFVTRRAGQVTPVNVHSMGALTKGREGREMVEMGFMLDAGAIAFTDCDHVVTDNKVYSRAMTYARSLRALIIGHPQDPQLSKGAAVTSGKFASLRGLPAVSPQAERMGLERDLVLAEMTGVAYHADSLSTAKSLPALERAKAAGVDVSAGVNIHHLTLNELDVGDYRTFFKVKPPLRSEDDRLAMVEAVASGLIDIISSMHTPAGRRKQTPSVRGSSLGRGGSGNPAACRDATGSCGAGGSAELWRALSLNPARRFNLPGGELTVGAPCRSGPVRPGRALRAGPLQAELEIQEHAVRRRADGGQGAGHMGRRRTCVWGRRCLICSPRFRC